MSLTLLWSLYFLLNFLAFAFLNCSWMMWISRFGSLLIELGPLWLPRLSPPVLRESAELFFYWFLIANGMIYLLLFTKLSIEFGACAVLPPLPTAVFYKDCRLGLFLIGFIMLLFKLTLLIELKLDPCPLDPCDLKYPPPFPFFTVPSSNCFSFYSCDFCYMLISSSRQLASLVAAIENIGWLCLSFSSDFIFLWKYWQCR